MVQNIAVEKETTQSSTWSDCVSSRAVDGYIYSSSTLEKCSSTNFDYEPWWRVDLRNTFVISSIAITNRWDCCTYSKNNFEIYVGNSLINNGTGNSRCGIISFLSIGQTIWLNCAGLTGRYVTVVIKGCSDYLTLCEVQVMGAPVPLVENLALNGIALQSSTWPGGSPQRAIDGNIDSNFFHGSCSSTDYDFGPWWMVDLQSTFEIHSVEITNRRECCRERIRGAEVHVGDLHQKNGTENPRCFNNSFMDFGDVWLFNCSGLMGRYVTVSIPGTFQILTLCEVKVYGIPVVLGVQNVAPDGIPTQSSTFYTEVEWHANDRNFNSFFEGHSCSHTQGDFGPWWTVDMRNNFIVSSVSITNRDAVSERINGSEIYVGNSLQNHGLTNPRCGSIPSLNAGKTMWLNCSELLGRYVTVAIPTRNEFLTLCEVQVIAVKNPPMVLQFQPDHYPTFF
ncbi:uncharacterized protein LOC122810685 [Protopterus annectens]|uniref:uncharacterized protein LOC122810685 n=1 Tax=Protopterus annectens TaxID=7888 RepID=UPI001CF9CC85|nr:uncharacterized protein LOC122810685 [Protopterus annectens]